VTLDADNNVIFTGDSASTNLPVTKGAYQTRFGGGYDGFVGKLSNLGKTMNYLSYLGGSESEAAWQAGLDPTGNIHVVGWTGSADFPSTVLNTRTLIGGDTDAFVVRLEPVAATVPPAPYFVYVPDNGDIVGGETLPVYIQLQTTVATKATVPVTSNVGTLIESFSAAIPAGRSWAIINQPTKVVPTGGTVAVKLTTTLGGKSIVRTINVRPIFTFSVDPTTVVGGNAVAGTLTLAHSYPTNITVALTDNSAFADTPLLVTIPAGSTSQSFTIATTRPARPVSAKITATYGGCTQSATLKIN
jgi:hypothetical protein